MNNEERIQQLENQLAQAQQQQRYYQPVAQPVVYNGPNNQPVVLTQGTATGFEQGTAAVVGLLTAGPLGAVAGWGAIVGFQGKWLPWTLTGVVAAPVIGFFQLVILAAMAGSADAQEIKQFVPSPTTTPIEYTIKK